MSRICGADGHSLARTTRVLLAALFVAVVARAGSEPASGLAVAPAFSTRTVEGRPLALASLLEHGPVVLDFWATWCRPCERSLPALEKIHQAYAARGVSVVAVSIDGPRNWARVRPFAASHGLRFAIVIDEDGSLARRYQVTAVPTSVVIAPNGRIVRLHTGWSPGDERALEDAVRTALPAPPADSAR